jgi:hypothetical protein
MSVEINKGVAKRITAGSRLAYIGGQVIASVEKEVLVVYTTTGESIARCRYRNFDIEGIKDPFQYSEINSLDNGIEILVKHNKNSSNGAMEVFDSWVAIRLEDGFLPVSGHSGLITPETKEGKQFAFVAMRKAVTENGKRRKFYSKHRIVVSSQGEVLEKVEVEKIIKESGIDVKEDMKNMGDATCGVCEGKVYFDFFRALRYKSGTRVRIHIGNIVDDKFELAKRYTAMCGSGYEFVGKGLYKYYMNMKPMERIK